MGFDTRKMSFNVMNASYLKENETSKTGTAVEASIDMTGAETPDWAKPYSGSIEKMRNIFFD